MRRLLLLVGFLGPALFLSSPASGQVEGSAPFSVAGTSAAAVDRFLGELRQALAREERAGVAAMLLDLAREVVPAPS